MAEIEAGSSDSAISGALNSEGVMNMGITGADNMAFQLTVEKLNGRNFREWAQSIKLVIEGKGKMGYLTGEIRKPESTDLAVIQKWRSENSMVIAWLVNSMKPSIGKTYLFLPTAKDVWDAVRETYSDAEDYSQIFDLKTRLWQMKQGDRDVTDYYMDMLGIWQELDLSFEEAWECRGDSVKYKNKLENERVFEFLAGLNSELDDVRGHILGRRPLPSTREVFAEVRREEQRRRVMLKETKASVTENSALAAHKSYDESGFRKPTASSTNFRQKGRLWCDHCKKSNHSRDTCWEIHGKPADWKPRMKNKGYQAAASNQNQKEKSDSPSPFNSEQLEKLYELFSNFQASGQVSTSSNPSASLAHQGNFLKALASTVCTQNGWIIDSGASDHMTSEYTLFTTYSPCAGNSKIRIADGSLSSIAGKGSIRLSNSITLESVLHVPKLSCNLLSVSQLTKASNCCAKFLPSYCIFQDLSSGKTIGSAKECEGLYYFAEDLVKEQCCNIVSSSKTSDILLWHSRMGHPNFKYMKQLFPSLFSNNSLGDFHCDICEYAKHHRSSFPPISYRPSKPFSVIHSDVWGPTNIPNRNNVKWFVTFIDDHTRLCWTYLIRDKTEVRTTFINFHSMIQTQFHTKIQILRTDNSTEYFNQTLGSYLRDQGIVHQSSCVESPQQNGIAERKNRHILEVSRALLFTTNVPKMFWGDAVLTATYLINRMPTKVLDFSTPIAKLHECYPSSRLNTSLPLKLFGCTSFVHVYPHNRTKLDPRSIKCIFLGYASNQKGYKCFDPVARKLYVTLDVTFCEAIPFYQNSSLQGERLHEAQVLNFDFLLPKPISTDSPPSIGGDASKPKKDLQVYIRKKKSQAPNEALPELEPMSDPAPISSDLSTNIDQVTVFDTHDSEPDDLELPIALRKKPRSCTLHPISKVISYNALSRTCHAFTTDLDRTIIPKDIHEARAIPEWNHAVMEEMNALEKNGTWEIVDLPKGKQAVDCKFIFTIKYKADGTKERCKVRLVAKGFTQTYGIDYTETFAPVAKLNTIRVFLSLAVNLDWPLQQLDIKNAFLNGELEEEVYMVQPPGFCKKGNEGKVCRLKKSLYGLKQSPKAWFDRFTKVLKEQSYQQGHSDHTLFYKLSEDLKKTILAVYVDEC